MNERDKKKQKTKNKTNETLIFYLIKKSIFSCFFHFVIFALAFMSSLDELRARLIRTRKNFDSGQSHRNAAFAYRATSSPPCTLTSRVVLWGVSWTLYPSSNKRTKWTPSRSILEPGIDAKSLRLSECCEREVYNGKGPQRAFFSPAHSLGARGAGMRLVPDSCLLAPPMPFLLP